MTGLSLFSGIGGLDIAFEAAGGRVAAMCEIDPFCRAVLRKHWPDVPIYEDIKTLRGEQIGAVDVIFGGFPCQPFSVAGNQKGQDDDRYLWPEFSRLVGEIRPVWVVAENVPGILNIAADDVCADLERRGYSVGIWNFEAAAVGAPHRRSRVFFVAHRDCSRKQQQDWHISEVRQWIGDGCKNVSDTGRFGHESKRACGVCTQTQGEVQDEMGEQWVRPAPCDGCKNIPYADSERLQEQRGAVAKGAKLGGVECSSWWESEPNVGRVANGIPHRLDRLRALGNAVVPAQAEPIFKAIMETDRALSA